jgi:hypothetical protein
MIACFGTYACGSLRGCGGDAGGVVECDSRGRGGFIEVDEGSVSVPVDTDEGGLAERNVYEEMCVRGGKEGAVVDNRWTMDGIEMTEV